MRTEIDVLREMSINLDLLGTELELDGYSTDLVDELQELVDELRRMAKAPQEEPLEGEYWLRKRYKLHPNEPVSKITDIRDYWQG